MPAELVQFTPEKRRDVVLSNTKGLAHGGDESFKIVEDGRVGGVDGGCPIEGGSLES